MQMYVFPVIESSFQAFFKHILDLTTVSSRIDLAYSEREKQRVYLFKCRKKYSSCTGF